MLRGTFGDGCPGEVADGHQREPTSSDVAVVIHRKLIEERAGLLVSTRLGGLAHEHRTQQGKVGERLLVREHLFVVGLDIAGFAPQPVPLCSDAERDVLVVSTETFGLGNRICSIRPSTIEHAVHRLTLQHLAVEEPVAAAWIGRRGCEVSVGGLSITEVQPHRRQRELDGESLGVDAVAIGNETFGDRQRVVRLIGTGQRARATHGDLARQGVRRVEVSDDLVDPRPMRGGVALWVHELTQDERHLGVPACCQHAVVEVSKTFRKKREMIGVRASGGSQADRHQRSTHSFLIAQLQGSVEGDSGIVDRFDT